MLMLIKEPELLDLKAPGIERIVPEKVRQKIQAIKHKGERSRSRAAWLALLFLIRDRYGIAAEDLDITEDEFGKPYCTGHPSINFSISHCEGLAACVTDGGKVGLDVEKIRPFDMRVAERVCSCEELEGIIRSKDPSMSFFRYWALKESCIKAFGRLPCDSVKKISFGTGPENTECSLKNTEFLVFEEPGGFIVSVCRLTAI
ncbi:MAG: 4'-phosphopantetheinyl transferase sfp [Firmicutes bacterium ADurb.Bin182]|nr:MAG: 4'-phosphopantetheinyl transferase sfp [Firmicutes bacterium ADurb.Bin182]